MKILEKLGKQMLSRPGIAGRLASSIVARYEGKLGPVYARRRHRDVMESGRSVARGLAEIHARWPDVQSKVQADPVFILSAGWRSGSTLMQRLVMSGQSILIWGEPYSHAHLIRHMANVISTITRDWPEDRWFVDEYDLNRLSETFTANLYPGVQKLMDASHAYMHTLLEEPARQRGFSRWGMKDVRLTIEEACFLRWLYPKAKIIFVCRNPADAYRSYRVDCSWYNEWPDDPVFTADRFGRHWRTLVEGFQTGWQEVDGIFIRYEDLCAGGRAIGRLEEYLGMQLDSGLLERKVGAHSHKTSEIPRAEMKKLYREVATVSSGLGYDL